MSEEKKEYIRSCSNSFNAYGIEYRERLEKELEGAWKTIPTKQDTKGVPYDPFNAGILKTVHLYSYSQAKSLMWAFRASAEANNGRSIVSVRMLRYRVEFEYKIKEHEKHEVEIVTPDFLHFND